MAFNSRLGISPLVQKRPATSVPVTATAEFGALLRIMQEANLDLLGRFYGGAELYYETSVAQQIIQDVAAGAVNKAKAKLPGGGRTGAFIKSITTALAQRVMREESQFVIDNVGAYAVDFASSKLQDLIVETANKGIPFLGLLATGWDALQKDASAIDKLIRAACAQRHSTQVRAGSPRAAARAVRTIMARKATLTGVSGASSTAAFGLGVAAEVGSFGAAAGSAEIATAAMQAVVDLIVWLVEMIIDVMDYLRGKAMLEDVSQMLNPTQQDFMKLFNSCPVLGCYMLATPIFPTSAFVWLVTTEGNVSSVEEIERIAIEHVNPLRLEASWIVSKSTFKMRNPENAAVDDEVRKAIKQSAGDAHVRSTALDKSAGKKLVEYATEGGGKSMPGFGIVASGGVGTHLYNRHEGKLHGLSSKLQKLKKTAKDSFVNNTRAGKYLQSKGVFD